MCVVPLINSCTRLENPCTMKILSCARQQLVLLPASSMQHAPNRVRTNKSGRAIHIKLNEVESRWPSLSGYSACMVTEIVTLTDTGRTRQQPHLPDLTIGTPCVPGNLTSFHITRSMPGHNQQVLLVHLHHRRLHL